MQYVDGNRLTLLKNGEQYFPALVAAIDGAREEVFLESYIYADDETGSLVTDALVRAAGRGVAVRLLIDGFGAREFPPRFRRALLGAGAQVPRVPPATVALPRRSRLRRMHRKIAAIDARVAFVGGINIIDDYDAPHVDPRVTPPRFDYAVRIEGPLAFEVRGTAARLWHKVAWAAVRKRSRLPPPPRRPDLPARSAQRSSCARRPAIAGTSRALTSSRSRRRRSRS